MKRYELVIGPVTHFLKATNETTARLEAQTIIDGETSPARQQYYAGDWKVVAVLREVTDLQDYDVFTPPAP